jgi:hypothetical protein
MPLLGAPQEVAKKRARTFPPGPPLERAKTVDAPRHQCFGETKHIQILRSHFDEKMRARRAHATNASKSFGYLLRTLVSTNFIQKRDSKSFCPIFACTNNPTAPKQPSDARGFPGGTPGLTFFGAFFVQRQRKYITPVQRSAKQYARP